MSWYKKTFTFILISCLALSGCSIHTVMNNEKYKEYKSDDFSVIYEADTKITNDEKKLAAGMEKMLENEYLELYFGEDYDIAVYNKSTGKVFWSNPVFHDISKVERNKIPEDAKALLFSQVSVEYYNSKQKKETMSSYPESYSENKNQVEYEIKNHALLVKYGLGTSYDNTGLVTAFTGETFDQYDAVLKKKVDKKEISILEYRAFFNSYTKYEYAAMSGEEQSELKKKYPAIEDLKAVYVIKPNLTNKRTNELLKIYTLLGIDKRISELEKEKLNEAKSGSVPAYFSIPVKYELQGCDLIVSVDTKQIEVTEGFYLTKVELLKNFGASKADEAGYLFLPDGSGSIINNNQVSVSMDKITIPFYGQDYAKNVTASSEIAIQNTLPVFGIKAGGDGLFAIVENGAAIGGVSAQITGSNINYNMAYPYFNYTEMDRLGIEGVSYAFYGSVPDVEYAVRYHFLNGDFADYSGMARYYQKYLEQNGIIRRQEGKGGRLPLDIEFLGCIEKTVNYFGIPVDNSYPVTTFKQSAAIMKLLKNGGISSAQVLYSGMVNGGMKFKSVKKIEVEPGLGGVAGFRELDAGLNKQGYEVFPNIDFTRIYKKGNGIRSKEDVSKYLNRSTASIENMEPATGMPSGRNQSYLINPLRYKDMAASFMKDFDKTGSRNLYLSSIGTNLSGNYSTREGVTRQTAQILTKELLKKLEEQGYKMKFDCGNAYVLSYADSLSNVAAASSHQRIESYSIPFVGMVLKGYLPFTGCAVNQSGNREKNILEAVESGAGLNYLLMYEKQLALTDTDYTDLFSVNYQLWIENIISAYQKLNRDLGALSNERIIRHEHIKADVNCVTYENGAKVYVNYSDCDYRSPDGLVKAQSYQVVN